MGRKMKSARRLLALLLAVLMIVTLIPITSAQVTAATEDHSDSYTVSVTGNDGTPVSDVVVKLTGTEGFTVDLESATGDDGVAVFDPTALGDALTAAGLQEANAKITVDKEGYEICEQEVLISADALTENVDIKLTQAVSQTATVSVEVTGNAAVKINNEEQTEATVAVGTSVPVTITPADGSYIKELTVNGEQVEVIKGEAYTAEITVNDDVAIHAVVVAEYTVSASVGEGGQVTLNGQEVSSLTVDENSEVAVSVQADEGYWISSVLIGGVSQKVSENAANFEATVTVTGDTEILVSLVRVYTVTVKLNADGTEETDLENEGGAVTVRPETDGVTIIASPNEDYCVYDVIIDDKEAPDFNQDDYREGEVYTTKLSTTNEDQTASEDHIVTIQFAQIRYRITAIENENGTVTVDPELVVNGSSCEVTVTPEEGYSVQSVTVRGESETEGTNITEFETEENDESGTIKFIISNVTEAQTVAVEYTKTAASKTEYLDVLKYNSADVVSNEGKTYVFKKNAEVKFETDQSGIRLLDADGNVIEGRKDKNIVSVSSSISVSGIQLWYKADDELTAMWHDVAGISDEDPLVIIIDQTAPEITLSPGVKDAGNYYTRDFDVDVFLKSEDISGIDKIEYFVTDTEIDPDTSYDEVTDEKKTLAGEESTDLASPDGYTISVKVNDDQNNSDYVCVWVRVTDKAGNQTVARTENFLVDYLSVEISLDGETEYFLENRGYFRLESRTATITVTDRFFDEDAATDGIEVAAENNDGALKTDDVCEITWEKLEGNTYQAAVKFNAQANYTWSFNGYKNEKDIQVGGGDFNIVSEDTPAPFCFTLDNKPPEGSVTIRTQEDNTIWRNIWNKVVEFITFGLFSAEKTDVEIEASDAVSPVTIEYYKDTDPGDVRLTEEELNEEQFTVYDSESEEPQISIDEGEKAVIYLKITDAAGNYTYISSDGYIVDKTASEITLTPSDENGFAGEMEKEGQIYRIYGEAPDENSGKDVVPVEIKITEDAESCSGIKSIEYWVENNDKETQRATLYAFDYVRDPGDGTEEDGTRINSNNGTLKITDWNSETQTNFERDISEGSHPSWEELEKEWTGTVEIDKTLNNSSKVALHVKTVDNAGNENESVLMLDIDITDPTFDITFDNNNSRESEYTEENGEISTYFDAGRTAILVITERTDHFNGDAATAGIVIKAVDARGNDVSDADGDGVPDAYVISDWTTEDNEENPDAATHTATIEFSADANYTWLIDYTDEAGNNTDTQNPDDLENKVSTSVENGTLVAPFSFTIDAADPTGTVKAVSAEGRETVWDETDYPRDSLTFGFWSGDKITVTGTQDDVTSPIDSVEYYKVSASAAADGTTPLTAEQLDAVTEWQPFGELEITQDEQFVVYLKITDRAKNHSYLSTNGLIVDHTRPDVETLAPEITISPVQPVNGLYNGNVDVEIKVTDPMNGGTYSGLKNITYRVLNMGTVTQSGTLYQFENEDPSQSELQQSWSDVITVDSTRNNSNDVVIEVYAEDNALNSSDKDTSIKIDITDPVIDVSYDNNSADSSTYFNQNRTATIIVTERNFDPEDVLVNITNTDGVIPSLSSWTKTEGTGNGDNTRWTATLTYASDGDYTFDMQYTDLAGNVSSGPRYGNSVAPTEFTIDKTLPAISVSYSNNNAANGKYFSAPRTATVVVTEHNFDVSRVVFTQTASLGGSSIAVPSVSWSSSGDVHTATISYANDGDYTFDVTMTDMAGNESGEANYGGSAAAKDFVIDQTIEKPVIGGVENGNAYTGDVIPTISFGDVNYASYEITLLRTRKGERDVDVTDQFINALTEDGQGGSGIYDTFERIVENDGIYTLTVSIVDMAGNEETETVTFTINRFGSVYEYSEYLASLIKDGGQYITVTGDNDAAVTEDLVITEYSAEQLMEGSVNILITRDGESVDADYTTNPVNINSEVTAGESGWYEYEYTIAASNFEEDGVYRIALASKYSAADSGVNESTSVPDNSTDTEGNPIVDTMSFTVDTTLPEIRNIANLEEAIINAQSVDVDYTIVDVGGLASVEVMVNGEPVEDITEFGENAFNYSDSFTLSESSDAQTVRLIATDRAGNVTDTASDEFTTNDMYVFNDTVTVSTNFFVRWYANKPLFWGTIIGVIVVAGGACVIVVLARKKKEKKAGETE